jgi:hypothetical protein
MFFADPVRAFGNLRRAAKPGARLRVLAWRSTAENPFMTTAERFLTNLPPRRSDAPGQFAFADPDRVNSILLESGWGGIQIEPVDVECAFPESALLVYLTRLGPVGTALAEADEQTRARVIEAARKAFDPYVHGGEVRFTAACWMICAKKRQKVD